MATPTRSTRLTYEDYALFPEDGKRHEIIDGEHCVTPSPNIRHQRISGKLFSTLYTYVTKHGLGEVFDAPCDLVLSDEDVVQPDVMFVSTARSGIIGTQNVKGAPDLVIEILSETTRKRDEVIKRKLYERVGVQEYWVVDPELEAIKIYRLSGQVYVRAAELTKEAHDSLTTSLLPDFRLTLAEIFD